MIKAQVNPSDIYLNRNQPYGYWRVGNPIVKLAVVAIISISVFLKNPSLTFQGCAIVFLILWTPFDEKSRFQIVFMHFGLGTIIVALLSPNIIPYDSLRFTWDIPNVAKIDGLFVISVICMMIAYLMITRAVCSRDYVWLIDLVPRKLLRQPIAASVFSHMYGILRFRYILEQASITIRSRGVHGLLTLRGVATPVDTVGLWLLYILREIKEMVLTIEYVIMSRIRLTNRKSPLWRSWSLTDYSIAGVLVFGVFLPQLGLFNYIKGLF